MVPGETITVHGWTGVAYVTVAVIFLSDKEWGHLMVTEILVVEIIAERVLEFEAAIEVAVETILSKSPGFQDYELLKGIERPNFYAFIIHWDRVEDHTVTFRNSDAVGKWREITAPFFAHPPVFEHWNHIYSFNS